MNYFQEPFHQKQKPWYHMKLIIKYSGMIFNSWKLNSIRGKQLLQKPVAMVYMEQGITFEVKMGDGSTPNQGLMGKLLSAGSRLITGESLFITHFTNQGHRKKQGCLCCSISRDYYPGRSESGQEYPDCTERWFPLCRFRHKTDPFTLIKRSDQACWEERDLFFRNLRETEKLFIHAGGTVIERQLNNETLRIDTGCVVAFDPSS